MASVETAQRSWSNKRSSGSSASDVRVHCCFTSPETTSTIREAYLAQDGHLDCHTAPELWQATENVRTTVPRQSVFRHSSVTARKSDTGHKQKTQLWSAAYRPRCLGPSHVDSKFQGPRKKKIKKKSARRNLTDRDWVWLYRYNPSINCATGTSTQFPGETASGGRCRWRNLLSTAASYGWEQGKEDIP